MPKNWQLVTEQTDQQFGAIPVKPTQILSALHARPGFGRGWHLWYDGRRLIVTEMYLRWRPRVYLKPFEGHYHVNVAAGTARQAWIDWLRTEFPQHQIWYEPSRRSGRSGISHTRFKSIDERRAIVQASAYIPLDPTNTHWESQLARFVRQQLRPFVLYAERRSAGQRERPFILAEPLTHANDLQAVARIVLQSNPMTDRWNGWRVEILTAKSSRKLRASIEMSLKLFLANRPELTSDPP